MSILQYVGARYVPKFMGPYSATTIYEALSVVDDGYGTSYISKIPTPAGTPLTDTDYWVVYGSSSGAIIDLQGRVGAVETDLTDNIHPDISAIQTDLTDIIHPDINTLKAKAIRKILVIGNSYVQVGCADKLIDTFDNGYIKRGDGYGFVAYTGHSSTFETLLDNAISDSSIPKNEITDIIFISAMGDTRAYKEGSSTFINALVTTLGSMDTKINLNFPNCKRRTVTLAETRDQAYFSDNDYDTPFVVHNIFKEKCNRCNFEYIGWAGFNSWFVTSDLSSDHYHPSSSGAQVIGEWIKNAYYGNAEYKTITSQGTVDFNMQSGATFTIVAKFTPDQFSINFRLATVAAGSLSIASGATVATTEQLPIPVPRPNPSFDFAIELVRGSDGSHIGSFLGTIVTDTHGIAILKTNNGISTTLGSAIQLAMRGAEMITYFI